MHRAPPKGFGSDACDTIHNIYLYLCTHSADPNPFRGTHCIWHTDFKLYKIEKVFIIVYGVNPKKLIFF